MTRNPLYNAILAAGYITLVASVMYYGPQFAAPVNSVLGPIAILSLFVLSTAVMGFLFFYEPVQLYLDNKKTEAANLFLKTLGFFACITVIFLFALFFSASPFQSSPVMPLAAPNAANQ